MPHEFDCPFQKSKGGTTKAAKDFDVDRDVERIHEAMKGWGTNEEPLIEILSGRDNAQRQQIRRKYQETYDMVSVVVYIQYDTFLLKVDRDPVRPGQCTEAADTQKIPGNI